MSKTGQKFTNTHNRSWCWVVAHFSCRQVSYKKIKPASYAFWLLKADSFVRVIIFPQTAGEPYKLEILDSIVERDPDAPITIYHIGASVD